MIIMRMEKREKKKETKIINKLKKFNPESIFLYGSRARIDYTKRSDFEVGIIFKKEKYIHRNILKEAIKEKGINVYPFKLGDIKIGILDTPFQKAIYLRELILAGKTIYGKKIIEMIRPPKIRVIDIIQDLRFNIGYAFASMHSYRNGDKKTGAYEFYKSCLYATRDLEILKLRKFPLSFVEIYKLSKKLNLGEYHSLVLNAYKLRQSKAEFEEKNIFKNISYLNDFLETQLIEYFNKNGNEILI